MPHDTLSDTVRRGLARLRVTVGDASSHDPQIQMAEDTAAALAAGRRPPRWFRARVPTSPRRLALSSSSTTSAETWRRHLQCSTGEPQGFPPGVLTAARSSGEDKVTSEPAQGVRIAAVVVPVSTGGSVLAGRSPRVVEIRESDLLGTTVLAWLFTLGAVAVAILAIELLIDRQSV